MVGTFEDIKMCAQNQWNCTTTFSIIYLDLGLQRYWKDKLSDNTGFSTFLRKLYFAIDKKIYNSHTKEKSYRIVNSLLKEKKKLKINR